MRRSIMLVLLSLFAHAALAGTTAIINVNVVPMDVERIVAGLEKRNRLLSEKERRIVSYHEMGHALVALDPLGHGVDLVGQPPGTGIRERNPCSKGLGLPDLEKPGIAHVPGTVRLVDLETRLAGGRTVA